MSKKTKQLDTITIKNHIGEENINNLEKLFGKVKKDDEFEFIFFGRKGKYLPQEKYIQLLKFFSKRSEKFGLKLIAPDDTLDVSYQPDMETNMRCTISGTSKINTIMKKVSMWKNHVVFKTLVSMWNKKESGLDLMKKEKKVEELVDIDDLDLRARLSIESKLSKEEIKNMLDIDEKSMHKIKYRYKQRTSLYIVGDTESDEFVRVDLTYTRMANMFKDINISIPNYELEIEYGTKTTSKKESLYIILGEVELLLKIIQQSNFIMTKSVAHNVINYYKNLLSISATENVTALVTRNASTLEIQHVTEFLPNRYAVTDKADGERHNLIIFDNRVYLISTNMDVKDTGIVLSNKHDIYNGSIVDGELIFIANKNRHIFLIFDCLFHQSQDVRTIVKLFDRVKYADDIVQNCFIFPGQKGFKFNTKEPEMKNFNLDEKIANHHNEIKEMVNNLNHDIEHEKIHPLIRRKYFIGAMGAKDWEIFAYAQAAWTAFTGSVEIKCPYLLDGLIFQPLEQAYVTNVRDSKLQDYKWKPPEHNSIDFYVEYEKDQNGKILSVYDNSYEDFERNKPYRICKLHVGNRNKGDEVPILFKEELELYLAYIYLDNGEVRDLDGNIISDKTVVEFYYNDNPDVLEKFKWIPMRTRYDKTESVIRFKRKYGNYSTVADKVWRSIANPVLMSDFEDLSKGNQPSKNNYAYDRKIAMLKKKIGYELIIAATKENAYFQQKTNLAKPMRQFSNWIKDNMIYTFCHPMYQDNRQLSVLDIGCGRGADIMKFYFAMVSLLVGIDVDREGLISAVDGAVSRYSKMRTQKPNFPQMHWIQADATAEFDIESQKKALNASHFEGENSFIKFFSKEPKKRMLFDRINCQFAVHYMLRNEDTWKNFKSNINNYLRNGGYFMCSCFDAEKITKLLGDKEKFTQEYTDENGKSRMLFDILRKYPVVADDVLLGPGNSVDVYISWFSQEGRYLTEYLVDSRYFVKSLKEECNLELVNTDNFENQYNIHEPYLTHYAKYEDNLDTRKFLSGVSDFYKSNSVNDGCKIWNGLFRYYVFRKGDTKQKGGKIFDDDNIIDFSDTSKFIVPGMSGYDNEHSCINSIHHILKNHQIIPKSVAPEKFCHDVGIELVPDNFIDEDLHKIAKKIVIEHTTVHEKGKSEIEKVVNGLNIFLIERDCNDDYDISLIKKNKKGKINPKDSAIILQKDGTWYTPVYHIDQTSQKRLGIFNMNHPVVQKMLEDI
jgi:SAM-dependent methyltransferase